MRNKREGSSSEWFILVGMILLACFLGGVLLSNHKGVKQRAAEVDRVQRDLIDLAEEIRQLSEMERERAFDIVEHERMARERFHWTKPGEFLIRIQETDEDSF